MIRTALNRIRTRIASMPTLQRIILIFVVLYFLGIIAACIINAL